MANTVQSNPAQKPAGKNKQTKPEVTKSVQTKAVKKLTGSKSGSRVITTTTDELRKIKAIKNAVAVTTAVFASAATIITPVAVYMNKNETFQIKVETNVEAIQGYSRTLKRGATISNLKENLEPYAGTGYHLVGVYKDKECTQAYKDDDKVAKNSVVYLKYEKDTFKVTIMQPQVDYGKLNFPEGLNYDAIEYGEKISFTLSVNAGRDIRAAKVAVADKELVADAYDDDQRVAFFTIPSVYEDIRIEVVDIPYATYDIDNIPEGVKIENLTTGEIVNNTKLVTHNDKLKVTYTESEGKIMSEFTLDGVPFEEVSSESTFHVKGDFTIGYKEVATYDMVFEDVELELGDVTYLGKAVTACGYSGNGTIEIPARVQNKDVIAIMDGEANDSAFNDKNLEGIVLPNTLKYIGKNAFNQCATVNPIKLNDGLVYIADNAFAYAKNVESYIPETVENIGANAFEDVNFVEVKIPAGIKTIGENAFKNSYINKLVIPSINAEIDPSAFKDLYAGGENRAEVDRTIVIEDSDVLNNRTMYGLLSEHDQKRATYLIDSELQVDGHVYLTKTGLFNKKTTATGEYEGYSVFSPSDKVQIDIVLPESVSVYDSNDNVVTNFNVYDYLGLNFKLGYTESKDNIMTVFTFNGDKIEEKTLVETIDDENRFVSNNAYQFVGDYKVVYGETKQYGMKFEYTTWTYNPGDVRSGYIVKSYNEKNAIFDDAKKIVVPSSIDNGKPVIGIGERVFAGKSLDEIILSENVLFIDKESFSESTITNLVLNEDIESTEEKEGVKSIGDSAFAFAKIVNINIPSSVEDLGTAIFNDSEIEQLQIGDVVASDFNGVFSGIKTLKQVFIDTNKLAQANIQYGLGNNETEFNILKEKVQVDNHNTSNLKYFSATESGNYWKYVYHGLIFDSVEGGYQILNVDYENMESKDVNIPDSHFGKSVIGIGSNVFKEKSFSSITLPSSLGYISEGAFSGTMLNNKLKLNDGLKTIGDSAFAGLTVESSTTDVFAYKNEENKTTVIPGTVSYIGTQALQNLNFTSLELPADLTYVGSEILQGSKSGQIIVNSFDEGAVGDFSFKDIVASEVVVKAPDLLDSQTLYGFANALYLSKPEDNGSFLRPTFVVASSYFNNITNYYLQNETLFTAEEDVIDGVTTFTSTNLNLDWKLSEGVHLYDGETEIKILSYLNLGKTLTIKLDDGYKNYNTLKFFTELRDQFTFVNEGYEFTFSDHVDIEIDLSNIAGFEFEHEANIDQYTLYSAIVENTANKDLVVIPEFYMNRVVSRVAKDAFNTEDGSSVETLKIGAHVNEVGQNALSGVSFNTIIIDNENVYKNIKSAGVYKNINNVYTNNIYINKDITFDATTNALLHDDEFYLVDDSDTVYTKFSPKVVTFNIDESLKVVDSSDVTIEAFDAVDHYGKVFRIQKSDKWNENKVIETLTYNDVYYSINGSFVYDNSVDIKCTVVDHYGLSFGEIVVNGVTHFGVTGYGIVEYNWGEGSKNVVIPSVVENRDVVYINANITADKIELSEKIEYIKSDAFKDQKVDVSKATNLVEIGARAFEGSTIVNGELKLNVAKTIGSRAFAEAKVGDVYIGGDYGLEIFSDSFEDASITRAYIDSEEVYENSNLAGMFKDGNNVYTSEIHVLSEIVESSTNGNELLNVADYFNKVEEGSYTVYRPRVVELKINEYLQIVDSNGEVITKWDPVDHHEKYFSIQKSSKWDNNKVISTLLYNGEEVDILDDFQFIGDVEITSEVVDHYGLSFGERTNRIKVLENGEVKEIDYTGYGVTSWSAANYSIADGYDIVIPAKVENRPVEFIGSATFQSVDIVFDIIVPSSVKHIMTNAFTLSTFENIILNGVETIQPYAFNDVSIGTELTINDDVKLIASNAFKSSTISGFNFNHSVDMIQEYGFVGSNFNSFRVNNIKSIQSYAFNEINFNDVVINYIDEIDSCGFNGVTASELVINSVVDVLVNAFNDIKIHDLSILNISGLVEADAIRITQAKEEGSVSDIEFFTVSATNAATINEKALANENLIIKDVLVDETIYAHETLGGLYYSATTISVPDDIINEEDNKAYEAKINKILNSGLYTRTDGIGMSSFVYAGFESSITGTSYQYEYVVGEGEDYYSGEYFTHEAGSIHIEDLAGNEITTLDPILHGGRKFKLVKDDDFSTDQEIQTLTMNGQPIDVGEEFYFSGDVVVSFTTVDHNGLIFDTITTTIKNVDENGDVIDQEISLYGVTGWDIESFNWCYTNADPSVQAYQAVIPSMINNRPVEIIGESAISDGCGFVFIPNTVKHILSYGISCSIDGGLAFESGSQLETLQDYALNYALVDITAQTITLPNTLNYIGDGALYGIEAENLILPRLQNENAYVSPKAFLAEDGSSSYYRNVYLSNEHIIGDELLCGLITNENMGNVYIDKQLLDTYYIDGLLDHRLDLMTRHEVTYNGYKYYGFNFELDPSIMIYSVYQGEEIGNAGYAYLVDKNGEEVTSFDLVEHYKQNFELVYEGLPEGYFAEYNLSGNFNGNTLTLDRKFSASIDVGIAGYELEFMEFYDDDETYYYEGYAITAIKPYEYHKYNISSPYFSGINTEGLYTPDSYHAILPTTFGDYDIIALSDDLTTRDKDDSGDYWTIEDIIIPDSIVYIGSAGISARNVQINMTSGTIKAGAFEEVYDITINSLGSTVVEEGAIPTAADLSSLTINDEAALSSRSLFGYLNDAAEDFDAIIYVRSDIVVNHEILNDFFCKINEEHSGPEGYDEYIYSYETIKSYLSVDYNVENAALWLTDENGDVVNVDDLDPVKDYDKKFKVNITTDKGYTYTCIQSHPDDTNDWYEDGDFIYYTEPIRLNLEQTPGFVEYETVKYNNDIVGVQITGWNYEYLDTIQDHEEQDGTYFAHYKLVIPETIEGWTVVSIAADALADKDENPDFYYLDEVVLPNNSFPKTVTLYDGTVVPAIDLSGVSHKTKFIVGQNTVAAGMLDFKEVFGEYYVSSTEVVNDEQIMTLSKIAGLELDGNHINGWNPDELVPNSNSTSTVKHYDLVVPVSSVLAGDLLIDDNGMFSSLTSNGVTYMLDSVTFVEQMSSLYLVGSDPETTFIVPKDHMNDVYEEAFMNFKYTENGDMCEFNYISSLRVDNFVITGWNMRGLQGDGGGVLNGVAVEEYTLTIPETYRPLSIAANALAEDNYDQCSNRLRHVVIENSLTSINLTGVERYTKFIIDNELLQTTVFKNAFADYVEFGSDQETTGLEVVRGLEIENGVITGWLYEELTSTSQEQIDQADLYLYELTIPKTLSGMLSISSGDVFADIVKQGSYQDQIYRLSKVYIETQLDRIDVDGANWDTRFVIDERWLMVNQDVNSGYSYYTGDCADAFANYVVESVDSNGLATLAYKGPLTFSLTNYGTGTYNSGINIVDDRGFSVKFDSNGNATYMVAQSDVEQGVDVYINATALNTYGRTFTATATLSNVIKGFNKSVTTRCLYNIQVSETRDNLFRFDEEATHPDTQDGYIDKNTFVAYSKSDASYGEGVVDRYYDYLTTDHVTLGRFTANSSIITIEVEITETDIYSDPSIWM